MGAFVIPSIFTAVDKFSPIVKGMGRNLDMFAHKADSAISRGERMFRKMTPVLSDTSKQVLSYASSAAAAAAIVSTATFSAKSIMDYETEIANLSAITGTSGADLDIFKLKIRDVATATKTSAIDVAKAFTSIGNNSPTLLKDAAGLAEVTKQSIILAQASKMELGPSADYLTKIMNQFNTPAKDAAKTIDLLAGGMVIGSTDINKVADAMLIFGGAAGQAGISLNESVTAIEVISDKVTDVSRLGTQFRNIFSRMEHASVLDKTAVDALKSAHVNTGILESKTSSFLDKLKELKKLQGKKGAMEAVFNAENMQSLIPLLNSIPKYEEMLGTLNDKVKKGNVAQEMADKNNKTLTRTIGQLRDKFVTWLVTSDQAASALEFLRNGAKFLTDHFSTIVKVVGYSVGALLAFKTILIASRAVMFGYNIVMGIYNALTGRAVIYTAAQTAASTTQMVVTKTMTAAQWALNAAMSANPIALVIAALAALAIAMYAIYQHYKLLEEIYQKSAQASKTEAINKETKAVADLSAGYQKLGMSQQQAEKKATAQRVAVMDKTSGVLATKLASDMTAVREVASNPFSALMSMFNGDKEINQMNITRGALEDSKGAKAALLNPKQAQNDALSKTINSNKKETLTVDFKNTPIGTEITGSAGGLEKVMGKTTSTMQ